MNNSRTNMIKMGSHISELRKKKGYTQKNLGDILDVSDKTVSKWEKGVVAPDITILSSLAKTLDVTVDEILTGEEEIDTINTIDAIDIYSNMTKNRLIKLFIFFAFIFLLCVFFVFRVEEYYSWHLKPIKATGDISLRGYVVSNNKESKIVIDKMLLLNKEIDKNIKSSTIEIIYNDKLFYSKRYNYDQEMKISNYLINNFISAEINENLDINELSVNIIFEYGNDLKDSYRFTFE